MEAQASCVNCGGKKYRTQNAPHTLSVGERTFTGYVRARVCSKCGEIYFSNGAVRAVELAVAGRLIATGDADGHSFKFIRKALGYRAADFASLLGVRAETLSRWENGKNNLDRAAWITLAALVRDAIEGKRDTLDALQAAAEPKPLKRTETVEVPELPAA